MPIFSFEDRFASQAQFDNIVNELRRRGLVEGRGKSAFSEKISFLTGTLQRKVHHGLGDVPTMVNVIPVKKDGSYFTSWCFYKQPDGQYLYLESSGEGDAMVYARS